MTYQFPNGSEPAENNDPASTLTQLYVWGYPLVCAAVLRQRMTSPEALKDSSGRSAAAPLGRFGHQRLLSNPSYRVGIAPNVDTLYSVAWVDLNRGPVILRAPDFADRYYTFQIGFSDTVSVALGQRTHGRQLPNVILRHQDQPEPDIHGEHVISPTRYAMLAGRILVNSSSETDLKAVHQLQDLIKLDTLSAQPEDSQSATPPPADIADPRLPQNGHRFFHDLYAVLQDWTPQAIPSEMLVNLQRTGIFAGDTSDLPSREVSKSASTAGRHQVEQGVRDLGASRSGWTTNWDGVDFGTDWVRRAAVAHSQIYVNPAREAVYPVAELDDSGSPLTGQRSYSLTFAPGSFPPVRYFWSLTMYHERGLLVDNPLDRYAIGDRTEGLQYEDDGSLILLISHRKPAAGPSNWIPSPPGGFRLMMRLYGPIESDSSNHWSPPAVKMLGESSLAR